MDRDPQNNIVHVNAFLQLQNCSLDKAILAHLTKSFYPQFCNNPVLNLGLTQAQCGWRLTNAGESSYIIERLARSLNAWWLEFSECFLIAVAAVSVTRKAAALQKKSIFSWRGTNHSPVARVAIFQDNAQLIKNQSRADMHMMYWTRVIIIWSSTIHDKKWPHNINL